MGSVADADRSAGVALDPQYQVFVDRPEINNPGGTGHAQPNAVQKGLSSCGYPGLDKDQVDLDILQAPFNSAGDIQNLLTYAQEAHSGMYDWCDPHSVGLIYGPSAQIGTKIGDDQVCFPNNGNNDWFLTFRVGRTVTEIGSWNEIDPSKFPLPQLADALTPVVQAIASRLVGW